MYKKAQCSSITKCFVYQCTAWVYNYWNFRKELDLFLIQYICEMLQSVNFYNCGLWTQLFDIKEFLFVNIGFSLFRNGNVSKE